MSATATAESRHDWAWRLLAAAGIAALFFARKTHAVQTPQYWAEDVLIFFDQAWRLGPAALIEPYGGYFHFLPRLIAALSLKFDPALGPTIFNFSSGAIATGVLVWLISPRTGPRWLGLSLALVPVLLPHSGEVFLNLTNLQWFTALFFFGALIKAPPTSRAISIAEGLALIVFGLTGPFSVMLLPAFAWRLWRERNAHAVLMLIAVGIAAAVQAYVLSYAPPATHAKVGFEWPASFNVLTDRLAVQTFLAGGVKFTPALGTVLFALLMGAVAVAALRPGEQRPARLVLLAFPIVMLGLILARFRELLGIMHSYENADRYFFLARVCFMWLFLLAAADALRGSRRAENASAWPHRLWFVFPAVAVMAAVLANFRFRPWSNLHWPEEAKKIAVGTPAKLRIQPDPWLYEFPGDHARAGHAAKQP